MSQHRTRVRLAPLDTLHEWQIFPWSSDHWDFSNPVIARETALASSIGLRNEVMIDSLWNKRYSRAFHDCHHDLQEISTVHDTGIGPIFIDYRSPFGKMHYLMPHSAILRHVRLPADIMPTSKRADSFFEDSSLPQEMPTPRDPFDTGFSVWFLMRDLFELRKLVPQMLKSVKRLNRYLSRERTGNLTASQYHDDNLAIQFGLIPTVADIQDFVEVCKTWRKAYDELRDQQEQVYTFHDDPLDVTKFVANPEPFSTILESQIAADLIVHADVSRLRATFHRTLKFRMTCPEVTGFLARFAQFIDAFGVLDPAAIWDAIPWSFVVDWIIPVSSWVAKHLKPQLFPADMVVLDYCESIKLERSLQLKYEHWDSTEGPMEAVRVVTPGSHIVYKTYVRKRFIPCIRFVQRPRRPLSDSLQLRRISVASSLIAQKLPGRRHTGPLRLLYWR